MNDAHLLFIRRSAACVLGSKPATREAANRNLSERLASLFRFDKLPPA